MIQRAAATSVGDSSRIASFADGRTVTTRHPTHRRGALHAGHAAPCRRCPRSVPSRSDADAPAEGHAAYPPHHARLPVHTHYLVEPAGCDESLLSFTGNEGESMRRVIGAAAAAWLVAWTCPAHATA